jgi:hypothetical protein
MKEEGKNFFLDLLIPSPPTRHQYLSFEITLRFALVFMERCIFIKIFATNCICINPILAFQAQQIFSSPSLFLLYSFNTS